MHTHIQYTILHNVRKAVLPIEAENDTSADYTGPHQYEDGEEAEQICAKMKKIKEAIDDKAIKNIKNAQDRYKRDYDNKHFTTNVRTFATSCVISTLFCILLWNRKVSISIQVLQPGTKVLLRNSAQDGRKGGKLQERWLGPYVIEEFIGKGVYKINNPKTGRTLKKGVNVCRLKIYHESQSVSKECSNPKPPSNRNNPKKKKTNGMHHQLLVIAS